MTRSEPESVSLRYASEVLGVSEGTVRNWIRSGLLASAEASRPLKVLRSGLEELKTKLASNPSGRLKSRANKSQSRANRVPRELGKTRLVRRVYDVCQSLKAAELKPRSLLIAAAQHQAYHVGKPGLLPYLRREYATPESQAALTTFETQFPEAKDARELISLVHQALSDDGEKATSGAIYTPSQLAEATAGRLIEKAVTIYDPCVGGGVYLIAAARRLKELGVSHWPELLFGVDTDPLGVLTTTLNLVLECDAPPTKPFNIKEADSLLDGVAGFLPHSGLDVMMTNPPWGAHFTRAQLKALRRLYPEISSKESVSFFVAAGLKSLKATGRLSFLMPESVLSTAIHEDLRKLMLDYGLEQITTHGKAFSGIMTPVIQIELCRGAKDNQHISVIRKEHDGVTSEIERSLVDATPLHTIGLELIGEVQDTIRKIEQCEVLHLGDHVKFGLGIVTGNNKEHLRETPRDGDEPIYTGKDVGPYQLKPAKQFTTFNRGSFQQSAKEALYRARPKLVYRFISQELIVALDTQGALTLNSANILVPDTELHPHFLLAVLNARYATYYLQKKYSSLKVLKKHLQSLPIPVLSEAAMRHVIDAAEAILQGDEPALHRARIDQILEDALGISLTEPSQPG